MLSRPINCYTKHCDTVRVVAAMANPVRWTILHTLFIAGPQQQKRLAYYLQVTESVLSRHVKILREAHLIQTSITSTGRTISVSPNAGNIMLAALPLSPSADASLATRPRLRESQT